MNQQVRERITKLSNISNFSGAVWAAKISEIRSLLEGISLEVNIENRQLLQRGIGNIVSHVNSIITEKNEMIDTLQRNIDERGLARMAKVWNRDLKAAVEAAERRVAPSYRPELSDAERQKIIEGLTREAVRNAEQRAIALFQTYTNIEAVLTPLSSDDSFAKMEKCISMMQLIL